MSAPALAECAGALLSFGNRWALGDYVGFVGELFNGAWGKKCLSEFFEHAFLRFGGCAGLLLEGLVSFCGIEIPVFLNNLCVPFTGKTYFSLGYFRKIGAN